jgi:hypothetical protein
VQTGRYTRRETYTIMIFAFKVPQFVGRGLALILSQDYGLIEGYCLVGVLQLRLHKFGCR